MIAALWENDLRHYLILLNFIAFGALIIYIIVAVLSPKRSRDIARTPANQTPFLPDEDLEGRRLERVQGWALLFAAVIAVALPVYWLREPTRQDQTITYFDKNSEARGAVLYAAPQTEHYEAAVSKQCANCHGEKGQGGTAPFRINGVPVAWKAPALNTELLRFREDAICARPKEERPADAVCEVTEIITYGRPGTPMQGWGVAGGGPLNDQGVADLVAYIRSLQLTPEQAKAEATAALALARSSDSSKGCPAYLSCPAMAAADAEKALLTAEKALGDKRTAAQSTLGMPNATDGELTLRCTQVQADIPANPSDVSDEVKKQALACGEFLDATKDRDDALAARDWALDWQQRRANVSDGQLLFELSCARCHTQGWSIFDPTAPPTAIDGVNALGLSGGGGGQGGGIGFNLRDGAGLRRFGSDKDGGFARQKAFVAAGSLPFQPYGINGMGSGKMPGFANMLTDEQLGKIIAYERYCLARTDYLAVSQACNTDPKPWTPPTTVTTTTVASTTTVAGG